eukprot:5561058-Amphidinium_carterae.1
MARVRKIYGSRIRTTNQAPLLTRLAMLKCEPFQNLKTFRSDQTVVFQKTISLTCGVPDYVKISAELSKSAILKGLNWNDNNIIIINNNNNNVT